MIRDASHVPIEDIVRLGIWLPVARRFHAGKHAPQTLKDNLIDKAAAVVAHIEDHSLFANLRKILFYKLVQPAGAHVGQINVSNAAATGLLDFAAVGLDPVQFMQAEFTREWAAPPRCARPARSVCC